MRVRPIVLVTVLFAVLGGVVAWVLNARSVNHWLAVHTGIVDMSGPYYAFWTGFGADLAEFSLVGAAFTGLYHLNRKYNCNQRGCWRIGTHSAAGDKFLLCYRHHPDYQGRKPTHEMIARIHADHLRRQEAIHERLQDVQQKLKPGEPQPNV